MAVPLLYDKHAPARKKKRRKERRNDKKKREKGRKKRKRLPRLLFLYRLSMYPRMQMQGFVPCHSSFIHKSHSLLNLFLYILHTSRSHNKSIIRHYRYIPLLLEFFGCGARRLTTDCSFHSKNHASLSKSGAQISPQ